MNYWEHGKMEKDQKIYNFFSKKFGKPNKKSYIKNRKIKDIKPKF